MRDSYRRVLVVAGMAALNDALLKMPDAHVVIAEPPYPALDQLADLKPYAVATESPRSRGPSSRRKWPVRR